MPRITDSSYDLKTLVGEQYPADYTYNEQARELASLLTEGDYELADDLERQREETAVWKGAKEFNSILVKKACEHSMCPHTRCVRGLRIGGIEI